MRRRQPVESETADPRLDAYRRGIARLYDEEGQIYGYFATRVETWWTATGPIWRRRRSRPVERPQWLLTYANADQEGVYDDDVAQDVDAELEQWNEGQLLSRGRLLRMVWLSGEEVDQAWTEYGWG